MSWQEPRPRDPQQQHGFDLIGRSIKRRRHALGWTQRLLEVYSGIDQTVISRLENGKQYGLRWSRFAELVDALGGLDFDPSSIGAQRRSVVQPPRVDLDPETTTRARPGDDGSAASPARR